MTELPTTIPGLRLFELVAFSDPRGVFVETYQARRYADVGLEVGFVQDNFSRSVRSTLRGLHYQLANPQGKLVHVLRGEVYDVAVDIRIGSPTFARWFGVHLSADNRRQLYVPEGFAHGFCVLSDEAEFVYKCTAPYTAGDEYGLAWDDPQLAIAWPVEGAPLLSGKDAAAPRLAGVEANLPRWRGR